MLFLDKSQIFQTHPYRSRCGLEYKNRPTATLTFQAFPRSRRRSPRCYTPDMLSSLPARTSKRGQEGQHTHKRDTRRNKNTRDKSRTTRRVPHGRQVLRIPFLLSPHIRIPSSPCSYEMGECSPTVNNGFTRGGGGEKVRGVWNAVCSFFRSEGRIALVVCF